MKQFINKWGKKLLGFAAALGVASGAYAQQYNAEVFADPLATPLDAPVNLAEASGTYVTGLAALTTNTTAYIDIPVKNWDEVGLFFKAQGLVGANNTISFLFKRSVDGENFESTPVGGIALTLSGTNVVSAFTNFSVGSAGFLRLVETRNASTNHVTNIVIQAGYKPWRKGVGPR